VTLLSVSVVPFLLEVILFSWSLAIDERGGYKNLCGSDCRSVIPYILEVVETLYNS
jgi:hypothetical protein